MPPHPIDVVVDIPSTIMVVFSFLFAVTAVWYAYKFSKTVGGEMGLAFRWVYIGVIVFALTRIDDILKVSGFWAKSGIDYKRVLWVPHSAAVAVSSALITIGFYKMYKAFTV